MDFGWKLAARVDDPSTADLVAYFAFACLLVCFLTPYPTHTTPPTLPQLRRLMDKEQFKKRKENNKWRRGSFGQIKKAEDFWDKQERLEREKEEKGTSSNDKEEEEVRTKQRGASDAILPPTSPPNLTPTIQPQNFALFAVRP
jgi:hypothetical protein